MSKLIWGVLGVSKHFRLRVSQPLSRNPKNKFSALASRDKEKAREAAAALNIERAYGSYEELLKDKEIQAVYIPLPNSAHLEWIEKAAAAGKHILCEKPLTLNAEETRRAFRVAEEKNVFLMEAFMFQFHPLWIRVKELISIGEIGDIRAIHTFFTYNNPNPGNIRNKADLGGGGVRDIGCYGIASVNFLTPRLPSRVSAVNVETPAFGVDTLSTFTMDYGDFHAVSTVGTLAYGKQSVTILGTGGIIEVPIPFNIFPDVTSDIIVRNGVGERRIQTGPSDAYACEFEAFAAAVKEKDKRFFIEKKRFSIENQAIMDAVFTSAARGIWAEPEY